MSHIFLRMVRLGDHLHVGSREKNLFEFATSYNVASDFVYDRSKVIKAERVNVSFAGKEGFLIAGYGNSFPVWPSLRAPRREPKDADADMVDSLSKGLKAASGQVKKEPVGKSIFKLVGILPRPIDAGGGGGDDEASSGGEASVSPRSSEHESGDDGPPPVPVCVGAGSGGDAPRPPGHSDDPPLPPAPLPAVPLPPLVHAPRRRGRERRVDPERKFGRFAFAKYCPGGVHQGWGVTCGRHTNVRNNRVCKCVITFQGKYTSEQLQLGLKRWLLLGFGIANEGEAQVAHMEIPMPALCLEPLRDGEDPEAELRLLDGDH